MAGVLVPLLCACSQKEEDLGESYIFGQDSQYYFNNQESDIGKIYSAVYEADLTGSTRENSRYRVDRYNLNGNTQKRRLFLKRAVNLDR